MIDQAHVFGDHQHLVGTVTNPDGVALSVAAICLTPGMLHHAGPYRLHVELAHRLAETGIRTLRFDLSGIGESLAVGSTGRSIDRAATETAQAMDFLEQTYGVQQFILFGLCSGADDSMQTALHDDRVVGFALMDGCGYTTQKHTWYRLWNHTLPRLLMPKKWAAVARRIFRIGTSPAGSENDATDIREFPTREVAAQQLQSLVDRGLQMHFVYTGGIADYYNYQQQFFDMFHDVDWNDSATTTFFPKMDHVGMLREDRSVLVDNLTKRIRQIAQTKHDDNHQANTQTDESAKSDVNGSSQPLILPSIPHVDSMANLNG